MKYCPFLPVLLVSLAACGNPVSPALKWIGTPEDDNLGFSEVFFKITDPNLISSAYGPPITGTTKIIVTASKTAKGTGAPYTNPEWRLDGKACNDPAPGYTEKFYEISNGGWTITIDTTQKTSFLTTTPDLRVTVTGSDGKSYTDHATILPQ
jgi:hypothetical protein